MNGKFHSEESLTKMIEIASQYVEDPGLRDAIVSKCHQEIGMLVAGIPIHAKVNVNLTNRETTALVRAVRNWRRDQEGLARPETPR